MKRPQALVSPGPLEAMPNRQEGQRLMANLTPGRPKTQGSSPRGAQTLEAAALWILDLGVTAAEARRWAADPEHPAASCLELISLMETLACAA
jgi:hypothetical protein